MEISTQKDDYLTAGHNATQPDATEPNINRLWCFFLSATDRGREEMCVSPCFCLELDDGVD
jgi:hypothetical protein